MVARIMATGVAIIVAMSVSIIAMLHVHDEDVKEMERLEGRLEGLRASVQSLETLARRLEEVHNDGIERATALENAVSGNQEWGDTCLPDDVAQCLCDDNAPLLCDDAEDGDGSDGTDEAMRPVEVLR